MRYYRPWNRPTPRETRRMGQKWASDRTNRAASPASLVLDALGLWLSWKTPSWVHDKFTDEIDDETRNGPVSDVLSKTKHAARFRHMVLPEVGCLEKVKFIDGLPGLAEPAKDSEDVVTGHSRSSHSNCDARRRGTRDR